MKSLAHRFMSAGPHQPISEGGPSFDENKLEESYKNMKIANKFHEVLRNSDSEKLYCI